MGRKLPWWKRLGAALAAILIFAITFEPSLDALICQDEAIASATMDPAMDHASAPGADHGDDGSEACVHGHCHHAGSYTFTASVVGQAFAPVAIGHTLTRQRVAIDHPKFALIRPPRT